MMKPMEDLFRLSMREDLLEEFRRGERKGLSQEDIDRNIRYLKRQLEEKYGIPFSKAEGGEIFKTGVGALSSNRRQFKEVDGDLIDVTDPESLEILGTRRQLREIEGNLIDVTDGGIETLFGEPPSEDQRRTRKEIDAEDQEFQERIKGRLAEEREKEFIRELEGRDFTQEMQDEQDLRDRERQMLEDSERKFLEGLTEPLEARPEEPMFELNSMTFDGQEVPVIKFKDGEILSFPEIEGLFRAYKTAPETNLGPETTRQIMEFLQQTNPTKEQFIRHFFLSRRLADGGEVETIGGIGTLNETAKNMFR